MGAHRDELEVGDLASIARTLTYVDIELSRHVLKLQPATIGVWLHFGGLRPEH